MPKTSVKTFLGLIHKLNSEMDVVSEFGAELLQEMNNIDFTSVTDPHSHELFEAAFEKTGEKFRKLNDMRQVLLNGLQRKVIDNMNAAPQNSRTRSAPIAKRRSSSNKTRRAKSI